MSLRRSRQRSCGTHNAEVALSNDSLRFVVEEETAMRFVVLRILFIQLIR